MLSGYFLKCLILFLFWKHTLQLAYKLDLDRLEVKKFTYPLEKVEGAIYFYNRTNKALNITFRFLEVLKKADKAFIEAYVWSSNSYRLTNIQFERTAKEFLNTKEFDLQTLFQKRCSPPLIFPGTPNVTFCINKWAPDEKYYPPFLPYGNYMLKILVGQRKGSAFLELNVYLIVKEIIRWKQ